MNRIPDMVEFLKEYREECLSNKKSVLMEHYKEQEPEFQQKLTGLVEEQIHRQKNNGQGKIQAVYLSQLMSSIYTDSHEAIIGMGNSTLYLDENRSQKYWFPDLVYKNMEKEMEEDRDRIQKNFVRLEEYEWFRLKQTLLMDEWNLVKELFLLLMKDSAALILDSALLLEEELQILTGNYIDKPETLWGIQVERGIKE